MREQIGEEFVGADAELARELVALRAVPGEELQRRVLSIPCKSRSSLSIPRRAWAAVALVLVLAVLLASPAARAALDDVIQVLGQVHLLVSDRMPDSSDAVTIEGQRVSLEEAQELVPFAFSLPACLPDGYASDGEVEVWRPNDVVAEVVQITWHDPEGNLLELSVHRYDESQPIQTIVGVDSSEPVMVGGREAALVRGGWDNPSGEWRYQEQTVTLIWVKDGVQYSLLAHGQQYAVDDLIAVAESVR